MQYREVMISEAGEYLVGVFRALFGLAKFREFVDANFVIKQYYDSQDGKILRVEIEDKIDELENENSSGTLH
jgi:hypothetical protein